MSTPPSPDGPLGAGRTLGPYTLERELGRGGQGSVWLASDKRLSRAVALKILTAHVAAPAEVIARFQREAEIASRLDDPGLCTIYEAGTYDGVPCIAMRYVEGETLAQRIAASAADPSTDSLSFFSFEDDDGDTVAEDPTESTSTGTGVTRDELRRTLRLIERAARSLHVAHEAGVVHRDIKPGNIIITTKGRPVILDFGLARDLDPDEPGITQTGDLFGTPAYMAPEQIEGDARRVDRRVDVYALGVVLFECLALKRPFDAPTRQGLYRAILQGDPAPLRGLNPHISRDLEIVCATAIDRDPERRYATAAAFADDLARVIRFEPIAARPPSTAVRVGRWVQRNPLGAALVAIFAVGFVAVAFALQSRGVALRQKNAALTDRNLALKLSEGRRLAAVATSLADKDPALSLLMSIEAAERAPQTRWSGAVDDALANLHELKTLRGHGDRVRAVAIHESGDRVLSGSDDRTTILWNVANGAQEARFEHPRAVRGVGFTDDGGHFWIMSDQLVIRRLDDRSVVWQSHDEGVFRGRVAGDRVIIETTTAYTIRNWRDGAEIETGPAPDTAIVRLSPRGTLIARRENDTIVVRRVGEPEPLQRLKVIGTPLDVVFPESDDLVGICSTHRFAVHDLETAEVLASRTGPLVRSYAFARDGKRFATALTTPYVSRTRRKNSTVKMTGVHRFVIRRMQFSKDGLRLLASGDDHVLSLWSTRSGDNEAVLRGHEGPVEAAAMTSDAETIVSGSSDQTVKIWSARPVSERYEARLRASGLGEEVGWSRDGTRLYGVAQQATNAFDAKTLSILQHAWTVGQESVRARLSPDGRTLALGGRGRFTVGLWDDGRAMPRRLKSEPDGHVHDIAWSPDGRSISAVFEGEGAARAWCAFDPRSEKLKVRCPIPYAARTLHWTRPDSVLVLGINGSCTRIDFAGDPVAVNVRPPASEKQRWASVAADAAGDRFAIADHEGIEIYSHGLPRPVKIPWPTPPSADARPTATWSPYGRRIAGLAGRSLYVWDADTLKLLRRHDWNFKRGMDPRFLERRALDWSNDGRFLAGRLQSGRIALLDGESLDVLRVYQARGGVYFHMAFAPDSRSIAASHGTGLITLLSLYPIDRARAHVPRQLTEEERERLLPTDGRD